MNIIIDIQGFKATDKTFIPKELAAYDGYKTAHYIFKPPYQFNCLPIQLQKQAKWLMNNHHCISWETGFTQVHQFPKIIDSLTTAMDMVYVKGKEKAEFIRQFTKNPVLEFEENPSLKPMDAKCFNHSKLNCICALSNVYHLYNTFIMQ